MGKKYRDSLQLQHILILEKRNLNSPYRNNHL